MTLLSRGALVAALLAVGCGGGGGGGSSKPAGTGGNTGAGGAPPPGQEAGTPGTRGGGGGAFGGGSDPDAGGGPSEEDAAPVTGDGPTVSADARLANDRPRDTSFTPVDAVTPADSASPPDMGGPGSCGTGGVCEMYEGEFTAALARARVCNPTLKLQCQMTSATQLGCSGCKVWVNSNVELDAIRTKWNAAGCQTCRRLCPAIACRPVTTGVCHSKMLAAPQEPEADPPVEHIVVPPMYTGTCIDQSDPVPF
jgi:hypothetical protein